MAGGIARRAHGLKRINEARRAIQRLVCRYRNRKDSKPLWRAPTIKSALDKFGESADTTQGAIDMAFAPATVAAALRYHQANGNKKRQANRCSRLAVL